MRLSIKQKAALLRLYEWPFRPPWKTNDSAHAIGVKRHGWMRTLTSLERKGLLKYLRNDDIGHDGEKVDVGGWEFTSKGEELVKELSALAGPKIIREATRQ